MPLPPSRSDSEDSHFDDDDSTLERLQKVLASAGIASRRHCEEYIRDGRVTVDGMTVTELGMKVDPQAQKVCVDGERIKFQKKQYFLVNKPVGVVCSNADPQGRPRVIDLLPPWLGRLFSVGRLDESSEGLLIVTNDGELAHALAHPRFQVERVYRCIIAGIPTDDTFKQLRQGLHFTEGKFRMRDVRRIKTNGKSTLVEVVLTEGQNREVRRLFARVGHKVLKLRRTAFGPMKLGELETAAYRPLSPSEVRVLKQYAASDPSRRPSWRKQEVVNPQRKRIKGVGKPRRKPSSRIPTANRGGSRNKRPRR
ncbi:pseudouridine synthase [Schlesneria sp. T3-172]|uniref:pseudouridine synthase n=1 Tax=Schlesneria sphaerica TaxID=3373610 RepID=UPI0037CB7025